MVFLGHFLKAVMPGALIEAMAQTAIVLFATNKKSGEGDKKRIYYFGSVKARFLHPAVPGDQMKIKVENVKSLPNGAYVSGEAFVDEKKIAEAELVFSVKDE
jgi:3-hydroxyacyl-[acyl-carrier-protein] dehydratase